MKLFGRDLVFLRRDTNSNIHCATADRAAGNWVAGCNVEFPMDKLPGHLVARRAPQLPGAQKFCKRCAKSLKKLVDVHAGVAVTDL